MALKDKTFPLAVLAVVLAVFVWSGIAPLDYFTWRLEVFPAAIAVVLLACTYQPFRLTDFLYALIGLHCIVLLVGGHYTYAEVPLFNWLRDEYHLSRNYYDRVGHFFQGFVPAMVARELLLRTSPLKPGKWLFAIAVFGSLGISAAYELLEWQVSINTGEGADAFLGTQGDIWDTQQDMFMAFMGATLSQLLFGSWHNKIISRLSKA